MTYVEKSLSSKKVELSSFVAEQTVLGEALNRIEPIEDTSSEDFILDDIEPTPRAAPFFISPEYFFYEEHILIVNAFNSLLEKGTNIDLVSLCFELDSLGKLAEAGGPEYIAEIQNESSFGTQINSHIEILKKYAALRKMNDLNSKLNKYINNDFVDSKRNIDEIIITTEGELEEIKKTFLKKEAIMTTLEILKKSKEDRLKSNTPQTFIPTLNKILDGKGPKPGHLWIVGAYQKVGKTTITMQFTHSLINGGSTVRFISLEMADEEIASRLENINKTAEHKIKNEDYNLLVISELKAPTIEQVISEIETCEEAFVVVDYLQIIMSGGSEREAMEKYPMMLKNAARRSGKTVIALSQTGNEAAVAPTRKKTPFKGSANIGAAADLGMVLYRDLDEEASSGRSIVRATLDVILNRHGSDGIIDLYFDKVHGFFYEKKSTLPSLPSEPELNL